MTDVIDVKQAVATAMNYFRSLMGADGLSDIVLEEVELSDDERFWNITLSALLPETKDTGNTMSAIALALGQQLRRVYRVFKINAETGAVQSMKMRSQL
jgi:hypothetical protein